jgi:hypothetical protein
MAAAHNFEAMAAKLDDSGMAHSLSCEDTRAREIRRHTIADLHANRPAEQADPGYRDSGQH